ncbi:MAG: MBL fold metallo-hydrolase [Lentisphaerae bacterium]|jgi:ribonuclease Z|nr:MBL fold metallo-hydrolase [Lentisphaerota bacterium]MBT4815111.1 MBL fold metallo-hydrolase [Lentisphaerota bacterium]MBT5611566.1 MBL fold metallo-hydrolase [Lentisphaerota bacterium]MBT7059593.1 MBL fold metallo-hydrolase [Lentisphaerota bacterium]MBT7844993.1 MBL fold metallo-hydrolase [Lentisphaerota bacterium]
MRFTLLGSGAVRVDMDHWGPAQVVEVNGEALLFDCGRGASMRLTQAGFSLLDIKRAFLTHLHYDHTCDFPYLFLTSWVMGRDVPMEVVGPRGTQAFCDGLFKEAYREDILTRRGHSSYTPQGCEYDVCEVTDDEVCIEGPGYVIRIVHVQHKSHILDNLAFRIEANGRSIVVVGDTTVCDALLELATGADLLVHECSFPSAILERENWGAFHTDPRELGRWARERGVKKLLLKHFCLRPGVVELEPMVVEVREEFGSAGLIVGEDLMSLEV